MAEQIETQSTDYTKLNYRPPESTPKAKSEIKPPDWHIVIKHYRWMIRTMKYKHDGTGLDVRSYSPKLTEAIKQLPSLDKWEKENDLCRKM